MKTRVHFSAQLIILCVTLLVAGCSFTIQPPTGVPTSGLVDIGGRKLFLDCQGEGSPTVLLEAGLGGDHTTWSLVQPAAAKLTRVCSYDRAGLGQSDPPDYTPRTSVDVVADLHALLVAAQLSGPFLLVGHSFGGLHVRAFAQAHPNDVSGVLLVDAVHPDWWRRAAALLPPASPGEAAAITALRRYFVSEGGEPAENAEVMDIAASAAQVRLAGNLGNRPLIVLSAGIADVLPLGLPTALRKPLTKLLLEDLPAELVQLSPNSLLITAANSGHDIPRQQSGLVVTAIKTLVQASRGQ